MKEKSGSLIESVRRQPRKEKKSKYSSLLKFVMQKFSDFFVQFYKNYNELVNMDIPNIQKNLKEFQSCLNYDLNDKISRVNKKMFDIESLKEELESKKIRYFDIINSSNFKQLINIQNNKKNFHIKGALTRVQESARQKQKVLQELRAAELELLAAQRQHQGVHTVLRRQHHEKILDSVL